MRREKVKKDDEDGKMGRRGNEKRKSKSNLRIFLCLRATEN